MSTCRILIIHPEILNNGSMETRRLELLAELSRLGSMRAVADALGTTTSTVSQQIAVLGPRDGHPAHRARRTPGPADTGRPPAGRARRDDPCRSRGRAARPGTAGRTQRHAAGRRIQHRVPRLPAAGHHHSGGYASRGSACCSASTSPPRPCSCWPPTRSTWRSSMTTTSRPAAADPAMHTHAAMDRAVGPGRARQRTRLRRDDAAGLRPLPGPRLDRQLPQHRGRGRHPHARSHGRVHPPHHPSGRQPRPGARHDHRRPGRRAAPARPRHPRRGCASFRSPLQTSSCGPTRSPATGA